MTREGWHEKGLGGGRDFGGRKAGRGRWKGGGGHMRSKTATLYPVAVSGITLITRDHIICIKTYQSSYSSPTHSLLPLSFKPPLRSVSLSSPTTPNPILTPSPLPSPSLPLPNHPSSPPFPYAPSLFPYPNYPIQFRPIPYHPMPIPIAYPYALFHPHSASFLRSQFAPSRLIGRSLHDRESYLRDSISKKGLEAIAAPCFLL